MGKTKAFCHSFLSSYKTVTNNIHIIFFIMYNTKPHCRLRKETGYEERIRSESLRTFVITFFRQPAYDYSLLPRQTTAYYK